MANRQADARATRCFEREISRRDLLRRQAGSGRARSSRARWPAPPARRRSASRGAKKVPTGGTVTWALEQDPGFIAPFGQILTAGR